MWGPAGCVGAQLSARPCPQAHMSTAPPTNGSERPAASAMPCLQALPRGSELGGVLGLLPGEWQAVGAAHWLAAADHVSVCSPGLSPVRTGSGLLQPQLATSLLTTSCICCMQGKRD